MNVSTLVLSSLTLCLSLSVSAKEEHPGKAIHDESCLNCHMGNHDAAFYTKKNIKTKSLERLNSMVRMCDAKIGTSLFDEDMIDIANYLNQEFYKFPEMKK